MKNQKGSAAVWVIVLLIIIIIAGAAYWYLTQNQTQPTTASTTELQTQQTINTSTQPRATQTESATAAQPNVTVSQNVTVQSKAPTGPYPKIIATYTCSSTSYWNIEGREVAYTSQDDMGSHNVTLESFSLVLYSDGTNVYDTNSSEGYGLDFAEEYAYHTAIADLSNHGDPLVRNSSIISPTLQQDPSLKKLALTCLYDNFPADTTGILSNFPKSIPLKTTVGATVILLPGQSATGVVNGENVTLSVDGTSPYASHLFVNGVEQNTKGGTVPDIGDIYFDASSQFLDGTALWTVRSAN